MFSYSNKQDRKKQPTKLSVPFSPLMYCLNTKLTIDSFAIQLTVAKAHCEKRICLLGGPDYKSYTTDSLREEEELIPGRKVMIPPLGRWKLLLTNGDDTIL